MAESCRAWRTIAALAVLASSLASHAAAPATTLEIAMQAHAGYFVERCMQFPGARQTLSIDVHTPHPVDFNIHFHTETATEFPLKLELAGHYEGTVTLPSGGEYCFMWRNTADHEADFTIRLQYETAAAP